MRKISDRPRIAVIGAGRMAFQYHLPSQQHLARTGKSTLAAVCDLNQELAAKAAKQFGIGAVYSDVDTMLRAERPDGVLVLTPLPVTHRVASKVLRQGY